MDLNHQKRCLTSLLTRKMQIKSIVRNIFLHQMGKIQSESILDFFVIILLLLYWVGVHCSIYKCSYIKYSILGFSLLSFFLIHPSHHSKDSLNRYHFSFIYMCVQYLHYIHPLMPVPHLLLSPTTNTPSRTCYTLLFSDFVNEKKDDIFVCLIAA
jgi:hypothetical protein